MAKESVSAALKDASGVQYQDIQQAIVGYVYGNSIQNQISFFYNYDFRRFNVRSTGFVPNGFDWDSNL